MIWTCTCGKVAAEVPVRGNHVFCYCKSCREFAEVLGHAERLDTQGGSALFQVSPSDVHFLKGKDQLVWMRLTEKGPLRWYTRCCKTPFANTLSTRTLPFASIQVHELEPKGALPPVKARLNLKGATGHVTGEKGSVLALVMSVLTGAAMAHITRRTADNPFFGADGKPAGAELDPRRELT